MPPREPQPLFWPMAHSVQNHQNTPSPPRGSSRIGPERHRNIDILIPLARQRESPTGPNGPCERRTDPAEPHRPQAPGASPGTPPPQHRCGPPGGMRRSFRTHRLCAIPRGFTPGWSTVPRWGTPNASPPQSPHRLRVPTPPSTITTTHRVNDDCFPQRRPSNHPIQGHTLNPRSGSGIGPERA